MDKTAGNSKWRSRKISEKISRREAASFFSNLHYAFLVYPEDVQMRLIEQNDSFEQLMLNLMEGRFFNETTELHYFKSNGNDVFVLTNDSGKNETPDSYLLQRSRLLDSPEGKFNQCGNYLTYKQYLDYDEDGQLVIIGTRMVKVSEA